MSSAFAGADGSDNQDELPKGIRHLLARLYNSSVPLTMRDVDQIKELGKYMYYDVAEILLDRIEYELRNMNSDVTASANEKLDPSNLFEAAFEVLNLISTQQHRHQYVRIIEVLDSQMKMMASLSSKGTREVVEGYIALKEYMDIVKENFEVLRDQSPKVNLPALKSSIEVTSKSKAIVKANGQVSMGVTQVTTQKVITREEVEAIEEELSKRVIGQPTAVKTLSNWLYELYAYGYGKPTPKKVFFSGLPGTGKDTLVREFVNAIHKSPMAYAEHVYEAPIANSPADLWQLQGSTTGHLGSESISPFVKWLVKHSGGKYVLHEPKPGGEKFQPYITENPNWKPGQVLPGYFAPEEAVLYINEVDKWSFANINQFLLRALEKGYYLINNPGNGLDKIFVPVNIVLASNDLIPDIASRDASGKSYGPPLNTDQLNEKVINIEHNPSIFRNRLAAARSARGNNGQYPRGYSEEFINRLQDNELVPLRALGEKELKQILRLNMEPLAYRLKQSFGAYSGLEIVWSDSLIDFMYEYQKNPESGARLMQARVSQLIEDTLLQMVKEKKIKASDLPMTVELDVEKNADATSNLILRRTDSSKQIYAHRLIDATESEKSKVPLTDAEFAELATLPKRLAKHVFGVDHLMEKIGQSIALSKDSETRKRDGVQQEKKAEVFFLLGFSSTGKTETGKAVARELFKEGEAARVVIDFNNIQSIEDLRNLILGTKVGETVIPSKFMQEYDRLNGRGVFMFEEVANAPLVILKALYDVLDEAVVTTFADGKSRSMSKVVILATGNAGEDWYKDIPRDSSFEIQMTVMREIYEKSMKDLDFQRLTLEKYFSEAFINRVGISRFLFYPPFSYESVRKVSILTLQKSFEELKSKNGERGWNLGFKNQADFVELVKTVEKEGFVLREQGRSIINFVNGEITKKIRWELRNAGVPDNSKVLIVPMNDGTANFKLIPENGAPLTLNITMRPRHEEITERVTDVALTSFHEAGHNFLMKVLLGDKYVPTHVTRIPGVLMRPTGAVAYLGVAESSAVERLHYNREAVLEMIAMTLGGDIAESLVTKGGRRHSGISDDIARATDMARKAVGEWGLSDKWGRRVVKGDQVSELSDAERTLFNSEVDVILKDARALGEALIKENFEIFKQMGLEIFEKGDLSAKDIKDFYDAREAKISYPSDINAVIEHSKNQIQKEITAPSSNGLFVKSNNKHHNSELIDSITLPKDYANIHSIINAKKKAEQDKVVIPQVPIFADMKSAPTAAPVHTPSKALVPFKPQNTGLTCSRLFAN